MRIIIKQGVRRQKTGHVGAQPCCARKRRGKACLARRLRGTACRAQKSGDRRQDT